MVNCPRCQSPVDESARTTCPICFTPLNTNAAEAEAAHLPTPSAQSGTASAPSGMPDIPTMPAMPMNSAPNMLPMPGQIPGQYPGQPMPPAQPGMAPMPAMQPSSHPSHRLSAPVHGSGNLGAAPQPPMPAPQPGMGMPQPGMAMPQQGMYAPQPAMPQPNMAGQQPGMAMPQQGGYGSNPGMPGANPGLYGNNPGMPGAAPGMTGSGIPGVPAQAGQPPLMPGSTQMGTGRRVSLTGEVIEDTAAPPPSYVGGALPPPGRPAGMPGAPNAPGARRPYPTTGRVETTSKSNGGVVAAVVVALVLLVGFGGWYAVSHGLLGGPSPKQQADKFFASLKTLDPAGIYETMEVDKDKFPNEKEFVDKTNEQMSKLGPMKDFVTGIFKMMDVKTGDATINGDEATVPLTSTINFMGQTKTNKSELKMKKVDGVWKVSKDNKGFGSMGSGFGGGGGMGGFGMPGGNSGGGMMGAPGGRGGF